MEKVYNKIINMLIGDENEELRNLLLKFYNDLNPSPSYIEEFEKLINDKTFFYHQVNREGRRWTKNQLIILKKLMPKKTDY